MADINRRAGLIWVAVNGKQIEAKAEITINPGLNKRNDIIGADGPHGYAEVAQMSSVEGKITDRMDLDTVAFRQITNATVTVQLNNGKTWVFDDAWYSADGNYTSGEGEIDFKFSSRYPAREF
jgi:hypothetical protein